jgi:tetratricopeptide (TPR) repeat protein
MLFISCTNDNSSEPENNKPTAIFKISPDSGFINTTFTFDASESNDSENSSAELVIRWDFENDGTWDTDFTSNKITTHQYSDINTYKVNMEVKDLEGLIDSSIKNIYVIYDITNDSLIFSAWQFFINKEYNSSLHYFNKLLEKGDSLAIAYTGIGWCKSRLYEFNEAKTNLNNALLHNPYNLQKDNIFSGLAFVQDALNEYENCIQSTDSISTDWNFQYDSTLNYNDIILLRAVNFYSISDYYKSYLEVKKLDDSFTTNINTVEGRAKLAEKIEELRLEI